MTFLRNCWYIAAWDHEVTADAPLSRRLLDEPVVLFRDENNAPVAISGVCPHRLAPLGAGRIEHGIVHCAYHGLGFDRTGACVHNPFGTPSRTMKVQTWPVVETFSAIWIWMGDADKADPSSIGDFAFNDPAQAYVGKGYLAVNASYELEIDNILDLSHIQFLHPTTLGSGQVANARYAWQQDGTAIWSNRDVTGEILTDALATAMGIAPGTPADRWIHTRWTAPANMVILAGAVPTGRPYAEGRETPTGHFFTPETAQSSHYFYSIAFPHQIGPQGQAVADAQVEFLGVPFQTEDLPMLEAQQRNLGTISLREAKLGWLPGDAAGARARQMLYASIDAEAVSVS